LEKVNSKDTLSLGSIASWKFRSVIDEENDPDLINRNFVENLLPIDSLMQK
jgi:hypothetical protein